MNKLIELAKNRNMAIEILEKNVDATEINYINGEEKSFEINNHSSFLIKAIRNNLCAKLITETLENPEELLDHLETIFAIQENENKNRLCKGNIEHKIERREEVDYHQVKNDLKSLMDLKKVYSFINSIEVSYGHYKEKASLTSTLATMKNESEFHQFAISITMKKEEVIKSFYTYYSSQEYDFEAFKSYILPSIENLVLKLSSTSCKTDKYNIILKNEVVANILESFVSMFHAKSIDLKESILCDKWQKKVFSEKINIVEDPQNENYVTQMFFDEEGTLTQYKELVKEGIFCKKINNLEYALKNEEEPTGNAGGVKNMLIEPKNVTFEELINKLNNGVIIDSAEGIETGINIKNGDISLQATGLIVKNKKITGALENIILSTNLFELFNHVLEVGNDLSRNKLDVLAPSLLIENITIAGEGENYE